MFTRHISRKLAAHIDGQLSPAEAERTADHLQRCAICQAEAEQVGLGMEMVKQLPLVEAPAEIWRSIEASLPDRCPQPTMALRWGWVLATSVLMAIAGGAYWQFTRSPEVRWDVVRLDSSSQIGAGEWMETDLRSRATIKVGEIGTVDVRPGTRLRVVTARHDEHRILLSRGEILAKITAPPKLFFVDTAAGTAVDLGCEYTLSTNEDGLSLLRVTKGWVAFQWSGLESLVPAGASCRTRPGIGPGIPSFDDAPENFKQALEHFSTALDVILAEARVRDTLSLWHLISRVDANDRRRVFDRIAALTPVPAGVSRDLALKLDADTLRRWKEELAWTW